MRQHGSGDSARPVALGEFPGIPFEFTAVLKTRGILHTAHFLKATRKKEDLIRLASATGIPVSRLEEMQALCHLIRIPGIGAPLAKVFYHAGIRSVNAMAGETVLSIRQKITRGGNAYPEVITSLQDDELSRFLQHAKQMRENDRLNEAKE